MSDDKTPATNDDAQKNETPADPIEVTPVDPAVEETKPAPKPKTRKIPKGGVPYFRNVTNALRDRHAPAQVIPGGKSVKIIGSDKRGFDLVEFNDMQVFIASNKKEKNDD